MYTAAMRQQRAIERAQRLGLWATVEGGIGGAYMVDSTSRAGAFHYVDVRAGAYRCDCEAGRLGQPCCHAAAVWLVRNHLERCRRVTLRAAVAAAPGRAGAGEPAAPVPAVDVVTGRPDGRGVGLAGNVDLSEGDGPALADVLATLGHRPAA